MTDKTSSKKKGKIMEYLQEQQIEKAGKIKNKQEAFK